MTPISLPQVTLVAIDRAAHALTRLALEDTLKQIKPFETIIFSDQPILEPTGFGGNRWIVVPQGDRAGAMEILWHEVPLYVRTSHFLHIEWDGWVLDGTLWQDGWLEYDYLGAPWPWHQDSFRVGNGGFSLRSRRLFDHLRQHPNLYPPTPPEDATLCRVYRRDLERHFRWGLEADAERFSLEHGPLRRTFGFHDCRNWGRLLDKGQVAKRISLANDYVKNHPAWEYGR